MRAQTCQAMPFCLLTPGVDPWVCLQGPSQTISHQLTTNNDLGFINSLRPQITR